MSEFGAKVGDHSRLTVMRIFEGPRMHCMCHGMPRSDGKKGKNDPLPSGIDSSSDSSAGNSLIVYSSHVKLM